ncbi:hypothetical protein PHSY_002795 [Pseudozyma hubeiensis SY62]|uniref:Uncharacterized protein n=1 Tax=Pseudozyma hubeiensis (strain SY62) TaxID=1305764 RepID=R9PAW0_PSEHS|nr:hypothetical protein PHSY_002795 [Pseudozyma hubeiensis SY62]GAC95220.1 hypothetical protein PHSY_002795 [Pseudozyma hubeiensis SY62]
MRCSPCTAVRIEQRIPNKKGFGRGIAEMSKIFFRRSSDDRPVSNERAERHNERMRRRSCNVCLCVKESDIQKRNGCDAGTRD